VVILAAIGIAGAAFVLKDAVHAASTLTIFMTAASRMAPAALRLQQNAVLVKNSLGRGSETLETLQRLRSLPKHNGLPIDFTSQDTEGIKFENVRFKYELSDNEETINNVSFSIPEGSFVALVGPTGSGKTTIINLIGGFLEPNSGQISIQGKSSTEYINSNPGAVGYVPQTISVINGSIFENIALGVPRTSESEKACIDSLKKAQLWSYVENLPDQIFTVLKGPGGGLSGGQLQRLGIARCLISNPRIILLDEATSSLDANTEVLVSQEIVSSLRGATLIVVAHRLSTVKEADTIFYLEKGKMLGQGKFSDVRKQVPNFENQAKLLGL
jgi:ABC-type multidrug transport system fused ATPase/permease subunit